MCWQHGYCNKIDSETQVPDNYVCNICLNPSKKRRSKQYDFLQDWIKEGKVARLVITINFNKHNGNHFIIPVNTNIDST